MAQYNSRQFPGFASLLPAEFLDALRDRDLADHTHLHLAHALISAVVEAAPQLASVTIRTRGFLRAPDVRGGTLLSAWIDDACWRWQQRGIRLALILDEQVHTRRIVLQGTGNPVEITPEWGLQLHEESTGAARRSEVAVYRHTTRWLEADGPLAEAAGERQGSTRQQHVGVCASCECALSAKALPKQPAVPEQPAVPKQPAVPEQRPQLAAGVYAAATVPSPTVAEAQADLYGLGPGYWRRQLHCHAPDDQDSSWRIDHHHH